MEPTIKTKTILFAAERPGDELLSVRSFEELHLRIRLAVERHEVKIQAGLLGEAEVT